MNTTHCVAGLVSIPSVTHPVFPQCFRGAGEWTRGHLRCDHTTPATSLGRRLQADWCECAATPRPSFPRKGNRCAA
jgi:hypothetical protein